MMLQETLEQKEEVQHLCDQYLSKIQDYKKQLSDKDLDIKKLTNEQTMATAMPNRSSYIAAWPHVTGRLDLTLKTRILRIFFAGVWPFFQVKRLQMNHPIPTVRKKRTESKSIAAMRCWDEANRKAGCW